MGDNNEEEIVDVVDENDIVIGTALKPDVYTQGLSNRIVHVFVIHPENGSIYLVKRGVSVSYLPNHYCTSAGGHVSAGEDYNTAAQRELQEEIGLETELHHIKKFVYECPQLDPPTTRFISLYATYASGGFNLSEAEVAEGFFATVGEVEAILSTNESIHPQLVACWEALKESGF